MPKITARMMPVEADAALLLTGVMLFSVSSKRKKQEQKQELSDGFKLQ